tara:strand:+ start:258 stop:437 length:180 start_codon:yes stop_codon:yes gene_type:complete
MIVKFSIFLTLILVILKLTNNIDWDWTLITLPVSISIVTGISIFCISLLLNKIENSIKE